MTASIVVVGCGVVGAAIAYHLSLRGLPPLVVDPMPPASPPGASWASAGGLRTQGRSPAERPLTRMAAERWPSLGRELEADLETRFGGHLHVAETESEAATIERRIAEDRAAGIAVERVSGAAIAGLAPSLKSGLILGAFTPGDGQAHPARTAEAFHAAALRRGARFKPATVTGFAAAREKVTGVILDGGERHAADLVIVAAGAWTIGLLQGIGLVLPLRWRGLQMLLSDIGPPLLAPTVTAAGRNLSLKQAPSGQFMIGGRWQTPRPPEGVGAAPADGLVGRQWDGAAALLPALAQRRISQSWAGVEAQSIDGLPFVGRCRPGLYLAAGFSNHGFQISPAIGDLVARDIAAGSEALLAPFAVERAAAIGDARRLAFVNEPVAA